MRRGTEIRSTGVGSTIDVFRTACITGLTTFGSERSTTIVVAFSCWSRQSCGDGEETQSVTSPKLPADALFSHGHDVIIETIKMLSEPSGRYSRQ